MSVQALFDEHAGTLAWVRSEFRGGLMEECDLRRWLGKLGYAGSLLEAEADYLKSIKDRLRDPLPKKEDQEIGYAAD